MLMRNAQPLWRLGDKLSVYHQRGTGSVYVGFMVDTVAVGQVLVRDAVLPPVGIAPLLFRLPPTLHNTIN